jgi:perosamine synthetase
VLYFKAKPVLVDCRCDTSNIDPDQIEKAITSKTKAIIPVHIAGQPCAMDRILEIARERNLKVIEDAAHALPTRYQGRMVGTIGDITCFSFYATKTITTGEGGMATTENPEWAERMRIMGLHGIGHDWKRFLRRFLVLRDPCIRAKYNLTDMAAALGSNSSRSVPVWSSGGAVRPTTRLQDVPGISVPYSAGSDTPGTCMSFSSNLERLCISRNEL